MTTTTKAELEAQLELAKIERKKLEKRKRSKEARKKRRRISITFSEKRTSMSYSKFSTNELIAARDLLNLAIEQRTKSLSKEPINLRGKKIVKVNQKSKPKDTTKDTTKATPKVSSKATTKRK